MLIAIRRLPSTVEARVNTVNHLRPHQRMCFGHIHFMLYWSNTSQHKKETPEPSLLRIQALFNLMCLLMTRVAVEGFEPPTRGL